MNEYGRKAPKASISTLGLGNVAAAYWNLDPAQLVEDNIIRGEGVLTNTGALAVDTGEFTGRSPKDRFIVEDEITKEAVWWGNINIKFDADKFDNLYNRVTAYLAGKEVYVRDAYACSSEKYRMNIRLVAEFPYSSLFAYNMFLRPSEEEIMNFDPEWSIVCAPGFKADPEIDGTRQHNFAVMNFSKKILLIGGTCYTG